MCSLRRLPITGMYGETASLGVTNPSVRRALTHSTDELLSFLMFGRLGSLTFGELPKDDRRKRLRRKQRRRVVP